MEEDKMVDLSKLNHSELLMLSSLLFDDVERCLNGGEPETEELNKLKSMWITRGE